MIRLLPFAQTLTVACLLGLSLSSFATGNQDDLARRATWDVASGRAVIEKCLQWIEAEELADETQRLRIGEALQSAAEQSPEDLSSALLASLSELDDRVREMLAVCNQPRNATQLTEFIVLQDGDLPEWVRSNLKLHYGAWLANQALYDEAQEQLSTVDVAEVADPAALLFYQALVHHRKMDKNACLETIDKLLENESVIPKRYSAVAKLMQADIEPLKPDSLDEISRLMDNIKVRLGHGRAGKRVRQEEDDVIAKLDKLIKKLEDQAQSSSSSSSSDGGSSPSRPMEDSMPGGVTGPGNVAPRELGADTNWGDLPPKEREEALQQLSRDLPSHYRDVIEQYFRKLSQDDN